MKHVVSVSSGLGSAYLWSVVHAAHPDCVAVFADVNGEHVDNYRFLGAVQAHVGGKLVILDNGGRTIWDVFEKERFLGNSRVDICSRELKRKPIQRWLEANCDPADTTMHIGIDWTEEHRIPGNRRGWARLGWTTAYLLADRDLDKNSALDWCTAAGISPPELTVRGWPHANCGGGCVRSGMGQFAALHRDDPAEYAKWEAGEARIQGVVGKPVTILRSRKGGKATPLSLTALRPLIASGEVKPNIADGSCRCMDMDDDDE